MATLNIVLHEPEIPQNTGNIGRTCAATGARLHIIKPMKFEINDKTVKRAGLDYWHLLDVSFYDSLDDFFEKTQGKFYFFSTKAKYKHTEVSYDDDAYLFFGKESAGLPEKLLFENPETTVRIPMIEQARSLNLSNAVAIAAYECLRQWDYPKLLVKGELRDYDWS